MRLAALLAAAVLAAGCLGPTYYLTAVSAVARFDAAWDGPLAAEGVRAMGFTPRTTLDRIDAGDGNLTVIVSRENGATVLRIHTEVHEKVGTRAAAQARGDEVRAEREADILRLVDAFAHATGWNRTGDVAWDNILLHGD